MCQVKIWSIWSILPDLKKKVHVFAWPVTIKKLFLEKKYFSIVLFSCIYSFSTVPIKNHKKKFKFTPRVLFGNMKYILKQNHSPIKYYKQHY